VSERLTLYAVAPADGFQVSATCALPAVAASDVGAGGTAPGTICRNALTMFAVVSE
jgi:hypothetical protein